MDVFVFALMIMIMIMVAGAATHRPDIVILEAGWMAAWIVFVVVNAEAAMKFASLGALGAYLVLLLLPNPKKI